TLRDSAALPPGPAARRVFVERIKQLAEGAAPLAAGGDARAVAAARQLASLAASAGKGLDLTPAAPAATAAAPQPAAAPATRAAARQLAPLAASSGKGLDLTPAAPAATAAAPQPAAAPATPAAAPATPAAAPASTVSGGVETVQGEWLELEFEARRCIHSRFC